MAKRLLVLFICLMALVTVGCSKHVYTGKNVAYVTYYFMNGTSLVAVTTDGDTVVDIQPFDCKAATNLPKTGIRFDFRANATGDIQKIETTKPDKIVDGISIGEKLSFTDMTKKMFPYVLLNKKE